MRNWLLALTILLGGITPAQACGPDSDCQIGDRIYRVYIPSVAAESPAGALVFAHGYKGSAKGVMRNTALRQMADDLGLALIALKSAGDDWALPHALNVGPTPPLDEMAYVDAVLADVTSRLPVDPERLMATGFSAGGMMVWTMACERADRFIGFVPLSGTFWDPVPQTCTGQPGNVLHFHGTSDRIVPLEGRPIADTKQGAVAQAISMYAGFGGFVPVSGQKLADAICEMQRNPAGQELALCRFDGGHSFKVTHLRAAWDRFQTN